MSKKTGWMYKGSHFTESDYENMRSEGFMGFIYMITETNGMKYIGKKQFTRPKILPITKTRKRRSRTIVDSDWREYYSSSPVIMENVASGNTDAYRREILTFGKSKGDLSYLEAKEQFNRDVLIRDDYYNGIINCKIHRKHLKGVTL
jgi:hypothetical protein